MKTRPSLAALLCGTALIALTGLAQAQASAPGAATNNCMGSDPECSVLAQITFGKVRRVVL